MPKPLPCSWISGSGRGDAPANGLESVERTDRCPDHGSSLLPTRRRRCGGRLAGAIAVASAVVLTACAGPSRGAEPEGEPYIRGPIESINHHATASSILVRAGPGSRDPCGIAATVDSGTRYFARGSDGALRAASIARLAAGDTVAVYVEGPVAESCPLQGRASAIVIVTGSAP